MKILRSQNSNSTIDNPNIFKSFYRCTYLLLALAIVPQALAGSPAQNKTMMQYFHWYLPADASLWQKVQQDAQSLADVGITSLWLPPAYKGGAGGNDVGYGVYDMYDLGEFNQKGSVATKYGTKVDYHNAINQAHNAGIEILADLVFNHRGGADATESVNAVRVARNNRNSEFGGDVTIDAWTSFDFPGRNNTYSSFKWHWYHFDAVDWAQNLSESNIFKFKGSGKSWDWEVDTENDNYDYLMFADLDMGHPEVVQELKNWGEWYLNETQVDGFRFDAVKHISFDFFNEWLDHMRASSNKSLFSVAEYWSYEKSKLHNFISKTGGRMSLFDAPLHNNFFQASNSSGNYDMRNIMDNTLMKEQPTLAVTLVDNHDTQQCQALESAVQDWFKPLAYAFILLREEGYPNIFYADYYGASYTASDNGCNNTTINIASHKQKLDILLKARRDYAYGTQINYLDHWDLIGWTRLGDSQHTKAMAVLMSDASGGSKWMNVSRANTTFVDITGNQSNSVTTNSNGWGEFTVSGGSYSVWVEQSGNPNPNPNPNPNTASVEFSCHNGSTYIGQNIYVVGSNSALGNWSVANAIKLEPSNYPTWTGHINLEQNSAVEWKCIKKEGGSVQWQGGANNRYTVPSSDNGETSGSF